VTVSTVTSWVIYGLRERVREAVQLGQYRLGERLGMGGMGEVYKASHAMLRRPTAVKLLPPEKTGEQNLQRFEREVQLTSQLTHPNTVSIYDYGRTPSGVFYYAMEYLDGLDLEQLVRQDGAQAPARVVHVLRQVCGSLAEAHAVGLIHRDVKPANIILCERGGEPDVAKVVDFGLVKDLLAADPAVSSAGAIAGTPLYLSPEAISAPELVGPRSDLYALGAVGYHLLTGTHVFESPNLIEVCSHHLHSVPVSPSLRVGRTLAPQLEAVILACLEKDPERRPRDAAALDRALEACADAGVWDREEAKRWWVRFRAGRPSPGASAVPSDAGGRTIQVSLDGRLAATADREVEGTGARATTAGLPAARAPR
jgi:serine/threonine-protein kinase